MPVLRAGAAGVAIPATGTSQAFTLPSGAQQGDQLVIWIVAASASNSFSSPGWTSANPTAGAGGAGTIQTLSKYHTGEAAGTQYTVTASSSDVWGGVIFAVGNEDQALLYDGGPSQSISSANVTTVTASSITSAYAGDIVVWLGMVLLPTGTNAITVPTGYTAQITQVSSSIPSATNISFVMATANAAGTPGATGSVAGSVATAAITGATLLGVQNPVPAFLAARRSRSPQQTIWQRIIRRRNTVVIPQNTGTQFPLVIRQAARLQNLVTWKLTSRNRVSGPQAYSGQAQLGQPWPVVTQQRRNQTNTAIVQSRLNLLRQRLTLPGGLPQGPLPPVWTPPGVASRPGWRVFGPVVRLRRSRITTPVPKQAAQGTPAIMTASKQHPRPWAAYVKLPRKRVFTPPWPQGPKPTGTVPVMAQARKRLRPFDLRRLRWRSRTAMVPVPKRTQQAAVHLTASSTLGAAAHVIHPVRVALTQRSVLTAQETVIRNGSATLQAHSALHVIGTAHAFGHAALTASSTMTANGIATRFGHAALTASSTLTGTATRGRGVALAAASTMTASATAAHPATVALTASSVLTAAATSTPYLEEIIVPPLAVPRVNEPPYNEPAVSAEPVTEAIIKAKIQDELFDP